MADDASSSSADSETSDWEALGGDGEKQARKELNIARLTQPVSKMIARHLEIRRPLSWTGGDDTAKPATMGRHRTALLLQRRGDVKQPKCARCQQNSGRGGLFTECVAAPVVGGAAFQRGTCASCVWGNHVCSLAGINLALDEGSIGRFLSVENGEFSLRAAVAAQRVQQEEEDQERQLRRRKRERENAREEDENNDNGTGRNRNQNRSIKAVPSSTFFGAFLPDSKLNRVGVSQRGPRCAFDGDELKWPISRTIWEDPRRLLSARSDLAHFLAIADSRLYEFGKGGDDDSTFWRTEERRIPALYDPPQPPAQNIPVQVPQTQQGRDKTLEVPKTQVPEEQRVIQETPTPKRTRSAKKKKTLGPGSSQETRSEIPDSQASSTRSTPPKDDPDDDEDGAGAAGSSSGTLPLATMTASRAIGTSGEPSKKTTGIKRSGAAGQKKSPLGAALDALNSIGPKRRSEEGSGDEPPEKRSKGGDEPDAGVSDSPAA